MCPAWIRMLGLSKLIPVGPRFGKPWKTERYDIRKPGKNEGAIKSA
jgi:hypothetical protein